MHIYILKKDLCDTDAGTRLYYQQGMYFYKTRTEHEKWFTKDEVENNSDLFRPITTTELRYGCFQVNT